MRVVSSVLGLILLLVGIVWLGQGLNLIPGSFMTGQVFWAAVGALCVVAGAALLLFSLRGRARR